MINERTIAAAKVISTVSTPLPKDMEDIFAPSTVRSTAKAFTKSFMTIEGSADIAREREPVFAK